MPHTTNHTNNQSPRASNEPLSDDENTLPPNLSLSTSKEALIKVSAIETIFANDTNSYDCVLRLPDNNKLGGMHSAKKTRPFVANLLTYPTTTTKVMRTMTAWSPHTDRNAKGLGGPTTINPQTQMTKLKMTPAQVKLTQRKGSSTIKATSFASFMRLGFITVQTSSRPNLTTPTIQVKDSRMKATRSRASYMTSSVFLKSSLARSSSFVRSGYVGRYEGFYFFFN